MRAYPVLYTNYNIIMLLFTYIIFLPLQRNAFFYFQIFLIHKKIFLKLGIFKWWKVNCKCQTLESDSFYTSAVFFQDFSFLFCIYFLFAEINTICVTGRWIIFFFHFLLCESFLKISSNTFFFFYCVWFHSSQAQVYLLLKQ